MTTSWPVWERGETRLTDSEHEIPSICWDHHNAEILADRLRRQILAVELEGGR